VTTWATVTKVDETRCQGSSLPIVYECREGRCCVVFGYPLDCRRPTNGLRGGPSARVVNVSPWHQGVCDGDGPKAQSGRQPARGPPLLL
jgi:hypothetical protein